MSGEFLLTNSILIDVALLLLQVSDVSWSQHSSTIFAVLTHEGSVFVFDISINKYAPICKQVGSFIILDEMEIIYYNVTETAGLQ